MSTTPEKLIPAGRTPLCWLVVNPEGNLLAILDSESEAYWFTKNRGHAAGAIYFKSPCDYAAAPKLLAAVEHVLIASEDGGDMDDIDWPMLRSALAKAKGNV